MYNSITLREGRDTVGFQDNIPIYIQIANDIKEQIVSGKLQDGDKIKSVREYSVLYEVTALTIQRAMQVLEAEGVIQARKGVGSFVISGVQPALENTMVTTQVQEFVRRMKNMGISNEMILTLIKEEIENG
jgi:DNA-binding transcriptional regulator YhcF (GntR family)